MTKAQSMAKARAIKTQRVKDKIQSAINVLTLYGDVKITIRAISSESGVSKTTVQKYISAKKEQFFEKDTALSVAIPDAEEFKAIASKFCPTRRWDKEQVKWIVQAGTPKKPFSKWL